MLEFLLPFKLNSQTSTLFIKLMEIKTCPIGDKPSPDFEPTLPVIEIDISDPNKSFAALDISFAISGLTTPYSSILFLSIFNILIFEGVEYVTTPPKKNSEEPSNDTIFEAILPPVQLSATEIVKFAFLNFSIIIDISSNISFK